MVVLVRILNKVLPDLAEARTVIPIGQLDLDLALVDDPGQGTLRLSQQLRKLYVDRRRFDTAGAGQLQ